MKTQVAIKQRVLEDAFQRIGRVKSEKINSPIVGPSFGYRTRARLSCRYVIKKERVLVGFRERGRSYVVDMQSCDVLTEWASELLPHLRKVVESLSIKDRVPQIEVAQGENIMVLAFRLMEEPTEDDVAYLKQFGEKYNAAIFIQRGGPKTLYQLYPEKSIYLAYKNVDYNLVFEFGLSEFTQVNTAVNNVLVRRAMAMMKPCEGERIADLFCGLGNFSLPLAKLGAHVIGIEGSEELVERARKNANTNGLANSCSFEKADLFAEGCPPLKTLGKVDKILIDPPRDGAFELVKNLKDIAPKNIVYVSCNPATLARDAGLLVNEYGYRLKQSCVVNMFPNTSHVESIANFVK